MSPKKIQWLPILDVVAKLIGAGAIVAAAIVAHRYESSMAATQLLVQREQADSNLRADMFKVLIGPFVGYGGNKEGITVNREQLLVELLALNFHEHFALKPLMMDVNTRLRHPENNELDQAQRETAQKRLRDMAKQIVQRQLASLARAQSEPGGMWSAIYEKAFNSSSPEQGTCIYDLTIGRRTSVDEPKQEAGEEEKDPIKPCSKLERRFSVTRDFDELMSFKSPNGAYTLSFSISEPENWENQVFKISTRITNNTEAEKPQKQITNEAAVTAVADQDFELTWFDFPFSDNTLLSDGTRFAFVVDDVEPYLNRAKLKLVWFPQDYIAAYERPTNYREMRSKLGINVD